ncbi:MAG TPA: beta-ketoacyl-ACP synthase II [Candidatus Saccharimonadales bacterium]|nr:beta-ketoacyl-ACP synthase II [Candidatus Saccharimonadales bacterium]
MARVSGEGAHPRRVVITGMGVVSPVGNDTAAFWDSLKAGRSGIAAITRFDTSQLDVTFAGEVKGFEPERYMDRKEVRRSDRFVHYAIAAAVQAVEQAGLQGAGLDTFRIGVIVGSGIGGIETLEAQHRTMLEKGPGRVSPFFIPMMISNMAVGTLAMRLGFRGPSFTPVSACSTGAHALGEAFRLIQRGEADACVAGGSEAPITRLSVAGFGNMKALSVRNDDPAGASRPFDATRDGFVMGEGAGIVVLEALESARRRGAAVLGEIVGYASTTDAYHMTAPEPEGKAATWCMQAAIQDSGLPPESFGYINAHGTSTPLNDKIETAVIKNALGAHAAKVAVSSTKSMTGHLLGAAGGVEFVACVLALRDQLLPPTINYRHPDPECDLDCVPNQARPAKFEAALSNSMGFGGHNVTLAVRGFRE